MLFTQAKIRLSLLITIKRSYEVLTLICQDLQTYSVPPRCLPVSTFGRVSHAAALGLSSCQSARLAAGGSHHSELLGCSLQPAVKPGLKPRHPQVSQITIRDVFSVPRRRIRPSIPEQCRHKSETGAALWILSQLSVI